MGGLYSNTLHQNLRPPFKMPTKLNKKKVREALVDSYGVVLVVAKKCNVTRPYLSSWLRKDENKDLLEILMDEREKLKDVAENKLHSLIDKKDFRALQFFLRTQAKDRGYVEKQEVEQTTTLSIPEPVKINVFMPDKVKQMRKENDEHQEVEE